MGAKFPPERDEPGRRLGDAGAGGATDVAPGAEHDLDVIEIQGAIKWFDVAKGFGFIVPDDGRPDVLLHVTCLRRDGYHTAYEGARVVVEALNRPGGLQAFRILSMDESTARHPAQMPAPRTHVTVAQSIPSPVISSSSVPKSAVRMMRSNVASSMSKYTFTPTGTAANCSSPSMLRTRGPATSQRRRTCAADERTWQL